MVPNMIQTAHRRVRKYFGMEPVIARKNQDTVAKKVVPHTPSPIQAFAQELEKVVDQMAELEASMEARLAEEYVNNIGKLSMKSGKRPQGNILTQAMEMAETAVSDMMASLDGMGFKPGGKLSKFGSDRELDELNDPDLSLTDNRSSVIISDGTVLTFTKEVDQDSKVKAVKPKIEITTPEGEKLTASLSDKVGLQRILDETQQSIPSLTMMLDPFKEGIRSAKRAVNGDPDYDQLMKNAHQSRYGLN
jgi:hypothetical protein